MYRIYYKDTSETIDIYQDISKNEDRYERVEPGSVAQLRRYVARAKEQYDIAVREFIPFNYDSIFDFFKPRLLFKAWRVPLFSTISGYVKQFFRTPFLQKIVQYPMVFLGTPPHKSPALYNIMSHVDFGLGVWYPQGGIYEIIKALVAIGTKHGVQYTTHAEVMRINVEEGHATGVTLTDGTQKKADYVVANADMHRVETHLLSGSEQTYDEAYRASRTLAPSGFIVYLGVRGEMKSLRHHTLIFSQHREKNFEEIFDTYEFPEDPSLYICCPSKTDSSVAPVWHENMFILVPFPCRTDMSVEDQNAYKDKMYTLIEQTIGETFRDRIVSEHLFTGKHFEERYHAYKGTALGLAHTLWQTALFRPNTYSKRVAWLYYVGGYTNPGIGMPMCLLSWKLVADRLVS